jgi:hypothetical protein
LQAIVPQTGKSAWTIEHLGKVSGILVHDGLAVAIGEKRIVAVNAVSGAERWHTKTYGHTTNLLWEQASDTLLYMDWKGLHRIERTTGKPLLDAKLQTDNPAYFLRMASPEAVVAIGYNETTVYNSKSGNLLFAENKLSALFQGEAVLNNLPLPDDGQELLTMPIVPSGDEERESLRRRTLLSPAAFQKLQESAFWVDGLFDVYKTAPENGEAKIWWVDTQTNRQMVIHPKAKQHDVSRSIGNVFAVDGKMLWAARIVVN